jgi:hypothetical protein
MKGRPIFLNILSWFEMIAAALVLGVSLPALLTRAADGSVWLASVEGGTTIALTVIGLYYLTTGVASVLGMSGWRWYHYLGTALTVSLSYALAKRFVAFYGEVPPLYFLPVAVSAILSVFVLTIHPTGGRDDKKNL